MAELVYGFRPVMEALKGDPEGAQRLWVSTRRRKGLVELLALAETASVKVSKANPEELDRRCDGGNHQGVLLQVRAFQYENFDLWLRRLAPEGRVALEGGDRAPLVLVLDQVQDPMNLGAIIRSGAGAGAAGVILAERRSAGVTPVAMRSSAGTARKLPVMKVKNVVRALEGLKEAGFWVTGAATRSGRSPSQVDLSGPVALVLGSEGRGMRRLVEQSCDHLVTVPLAAGVESLNVSAAAAVLSYEVRRQQGWGEADS